MDIKGLHTKISEQNFTLKRVMANSVAPGRTIDQTKNLLYNNIEEIIEALAFAADAEQQIKVLELELSDAEREIDELEKQTKKTTLKKRNGGFSGE